MFSNLATGKLGKTLKIMAMSAIIMALLAACGKNDLSLTFKGADDGTVIATYKDGKVTEKEYNKFKSGIALLQGIDESFLDQEGFREEFLKQYISYKIMASATSEEDKAAAKEEAAASIEQTKTAMAQYGDFKDMLKEKNLTENDFSTLILLAVTSNKYIQSQVTDDMLKAEYEAKKADYTLYSGRQIVIKTSVTDAAGKETSTRTDEEALARAKEVQAKLAAGGSWDELAKEYSDDAANNQTGGAFTDYLGGYWIEAVKTAAFTLPLNEISEPLQSSVGYNVVMIEKRDVLEYDALAESTVSIIRNVVANTINAEFAQKTLPEYDINITFPATEGSTEEEGTNDSEAEETSEPSAEPSATDDAAKTTE